MAPTVDSAYDLLSFAINDTHAQDETKPIYIDAEDPSRSLTGAQTKALVRKCIAGFKKAGLKRGEVVLVMLANNVSDRPHLLEEVLT